MSSLITKLLVLVDTRIHTDDVDPLHALMLLTSRTGHHLVNAIENSHSRSPHLLNQWGILGKRNTLWFSLFPHRLLRPKRPRGFKFLSSILARQKMGLTWDLLGTYLGLTRLCVRTESWAWLYLESHRKGTAFPARGKQLSRLLSRCCPGCCASVGFLTVLTVYNYRISTYKTHAQNF